MQGNCIGALTIILVVLFSACKKDAPETNTTTDEITVPAGFPAITFPADNAYTQVRWELGKKLFLKT